MSRRALYLALLLAAPLSGCDCGSSKDPVHLVGRLAFSDNFGCESPVVSSPLSVSECNLLKRRFDAASGKPLEGDALPADALRGLPATVELSYLAVDGGTTRVCGKQTFQTDQDGIFKITFLEGCGAGEKVRVMAKAHLQWGLWSSDRSRVGYLRALWKQEEKDAFFGGLGFLSEISEGPGFSETIDGKTFNWSFPAVGFIVDVDGGEPAGTGGAIPTINLGTQVFLTSSSEDPYDYMRQVLSAYTTVVELTARLRAELGDTASFYEGFFREVKTLDLGLSYLLRYAVIAGPANAGAGGMNLYAPYKPLYEKDGKKKAPGDIARTVASTRLLGHEFGHSVHHGLAGGPRRFEYDFASLMIRPGETAPYDWGHGGNQYQDLGASMGEGVANGIGQYLLDRCSNSDPTRRPLVGGTDPFRANEWNGDVACDADDGCGHHHFRFHMSKRGIAEGSAEWTNRRQRLIDLTTAATNAGHRFVTSNSEWRYGEFVCDLLDADTNVSHAVGRVAGLTYVSDFTSTVGKILDGETPVAVTRTFDADPTPEAVKVSLAQLLVGLKDMCASCDTLPTAYGADFNRLRLSAKDGMQSPRALGATMVSKGFFADAQLRNLLRSDFMEDGF